MNTPGTIAARAINAHPWLDAVYPELDDTDLLISPPWPAECSDRPGGHIEGRATWNTTSTGAVNYHITLAYEGPDGTVEDETTVEIDPLEHDIRFVEDNWENPLAWLELARPVAELMGRLHAEAHAGVLA